MPLNQSSQNSPQKLKTGALSKDEMRYIDEQRNVVPPGEIAEQLNRKIDPILKYIKKRPQGYDKYREEVKESKRSSKKKTKLVPDKPNNPSNVIYNQVKAELTQTELRVFNELWTRMVKQFKFDVVFSEEKQIKDWCLFQIKADRESIKQKILTQELHRIKESLGLEESMANPDQRRIQKLDSQLMMIMSEVGESEKTYLKYYELQDSITKELNASRKQRVLTATDGKQNFIGILKSLEDEDLRMKEGRDMKLMNEASNQALRRLGDYHTYADGNLDRPIFSHETLSEEDVIEGDIEDE